MKYASAYLRNALFVLEAYDGKMPLAAFLKQFFARHKKFGSKDRKHIAALCHQYFRLGHFASNWHMEDRVLLADWLCHLDAGAVVAALWPEKLSDIHGSVSDKCAFLSIPFTPKKHTPWFALLQKQTDPKSYASSFFIQPSLFLRVRPGHKPSIQKKIAAVGLDFNWKTEDALELPNAQKDISQWLDVNREVVVQDWSSQQCGKIIFNQLPDLQGVVWDCCSASGGKTMMMADIYGNRLRFLVSDIRASILHNLQKRFAEADFQNYTLFEADLEKPVSHAALLKGVDILLADVPCTGSGTWARTPERHFYFDEKQIKLFIEMQKAIVGNAIPHVKKGGTIIYITCSVFSGENEDQISFFENQYGLTTQFSEIIDGTGKKADSMFLAILRKN